MMRGMSGRSLATKLLLATTSTHALAQSAAGAPSAKVQRGGLKEITVTARRVKERSQTVPVSVSSLTAKELTARGVTTIEGVAKSSPNLNISASSSSPNAAVLTVRGLTQINSVMAIDPTVGVYVDDVHCARAYSVLTDLLDVGDVEVLNGPQGTSDRPNMAASFGLAVVTTFQPAQPPLMWSRQVIMRAMW